LVEGGNRYEESGGAKKKKKKGGPPPPPPPKETKQPTHLCVYVCEREKECGWCEWESVQNGNSDCAREGERQWRRRRETGRACESERARQCAGGSDTVCEREIASICVYTRACHGLDCVYLYACTHMRTRTHTDTQRWTCVRAHTLVYACMFVGECEMYAPQTDQGISYYTRDNPCRCRTVWLVDVMVRKSGLYAFVLHVVVSIYRCACS